MPCRHCPRTSIEEFRWNSKSCPEGFPRKKNGRITRNAVAITTSRGKGKISPSVRLTEDSCGFVCRRSTEDEFSREWPPDVSAERLLLKARQLSNSGSAAFDATRDGYCG